MIAIMALSFLISWWHSVYARCRYVGEASDKISSYCLSFYTHHGTYCHIGFTMGDYLRSARSTFSITWYYILKCMFITYVDQIGFKDCWHLLLDLIPGSLSVQAMVFYQIISFFFISVALMITDGTIWKKDWRIFHRYGCYRQRFIHYCPDWTNCDQMDRLAAKNISPTCT